MTPQRVLVPIDGSPQAEKALTYATETFPDTEIVVVHVLNPAAGTTDIEGIMTDTAGVVDEQQRFANTLFEQARETAGDQLVDSEILAGRAANEIIKYVAEHDIDAIVMGSHGRDGAARLLLGSVSETVVRRSPVPVTVVR